MKNTTLALAIAAITAGSIAPAFAYEAGDILVRARIINVMPNDDSSDLSLNGTNIALTDVQVNNNLSLDIDFTYMITPHWGAELLLDISSKHTVRSKGATLKTLASKIADVRVLPPSLIMQYHFLPNSNFRPYAGIGINYTHFFDEDLDSDATDGAIAASGLELDDSWGLVGQIGADYDVGNDWFLNIDLKYIDIDTEANFNGLGGKLKANVDIDPWVFGIGIGTRF
ncbi:MAG: OmpW family protein [Methylococcales bacterium]|jgi:outer membrane protein|nr:OmpW family protein [Methylococcales bacterium]MBT7443548.1 OmpW family protein [Methylococcales bacterium]